jgi:hypothetical protein
LDLGFLEDLVGIGESVVFESRWAAVGMAIRDASQGTEKTLSLVNGIRITQK